MRAFFVCILALGLLGACGTTRLSAAVHRSVMPIDAEGHMIAVRSPLAGDAPATDHASRAHAHARHMIDALLQPGAGKPLIYLHGGLNQVDKSTSTADEYITPMREAGYHPILINWESGFGPAYRKHLTRSANGRVSTRWHKATAPVTLLWDFASAYLLAPASLYSAAIDSGRGNEIFHRRRWFDLMGQLRICGTPEAVDATACRVDHGGPYAHDWPVLGARVRKTLLWSLMGPLRLAVTPIVDELGGATWKEMLRNTRNVFNPDREFVAGRADDTTDTGALAVLLEDLAKRLEQTKQEVSFTLVAHSMGAILVNELLRRYQRHPRIHFDQIVYLAAASSTRESMHAVQGYLHANAHARFYAVVLHPFAEDRERSAGTLAPDGSLLVWVDSMFETSPHFLDRRFGRWENLEPVLPLLLREQGMAPLDKHSDPNALPRRMHFTVQGFGSAPQRHAELNDVERRFWCPAFWKGQPLGATVRCAEPGPPPPGANDVSMVAPAPVQASDAED